MRNKIKLIYGMFFMLMLGLVYAWSIFVQPLENEFGWQRDQTSTIFSICLSLWCIGGVVGGYLSKRFSMKISFIVSAVLLGGGLIGASYTEKLIHMYIFYGIFVGFAVGVAYNGIITVIKGSFTEKIGLYLGLVLMCYALGGMLFGAVLTYLLKIYDWRIIFRFIGALYFFISIAAVIILDVKKESKVDNKEESDGLTPIQMLKTASFYQYYIWGSCMVGIADVAIAHVSLCMSMFTSITWVITFGVSGLSLLNGVGRVFMGRLADKIGIGKVLRLAQILTIMATFLIVAGMFMKAPFVLVIGFMITGLAYSGVTPAVAMISEALYGKKYEAVNYALLASCGIPGAIIAGVFIGKIEKWTGGYVIPYIILLVLSVIAIALLVPLYKKLQKTKSH